LRRPETRRIARINPMGRTIVCAAIQMDARPAPTVERLERANRLVEQAAAAGAQLVALPELFNTGYAYLPQNYCQAEDLLGPTVSWLRATASRLQIHLAGSLLLRQQGEIYNALLLFSPQGEMWRYDKSYPWGWERAYFRSGNGPVVADTGLGRIGLLICWDAGHPQLWRQYAGNVDLMVLCSCPPRVTDSQYHLPGRAPIAYDSLGWLMAKNKDVELRVFQKMAAEQTAWLGVPLLATTACGKIRTPIPRGRASLLGLVLSAPWLLKHLPLADRLEMSCGMTPGCHVLAADGSRLASIAQADGEALALARIQVADHRPVPAAPQPPAPISWSTYLLSDRYLPALCGLVYRQGLRLAEKCKEG
jgi:predicted amidohydrolase